MTAEYNGGSAISQLCLCPEDISSGMYDDSTLSESSSDPLLNINGCVNIYSQNGYGDWKYLLPIQDPVSAAARGLIPVQFDFASFHNAQDHRSEKSRNDKIVPPNVQSRRRAQNRASQQAFRDRRKKRLTELEEKLTELKALYSDLDQSYKTLQLECSTAKNELEILQRLNSKHESVATVPRSYQFGMGEWDESRTVTLDPMLFDVF